MRQVLLDMRAGNVSDAHTMQLDARCTAKQCTIIGRYTVQKIEEKFIVHRSILLNLKMLGVFLTT